MRKKYKLMMVIMSCILLLSGCSSGNNYNMDSGIVSNNSMAYNTGIRNGDYQKEDVVYEDAELVEENEPNQLQSNRKLIRTVRTTLEISNNQINNVSSGLTDYVESVGGYVESNDMSNSETDISVYLVLRVPEEYVDNLLDKLKDKNIKIESLSDNVEDVTLEYVDTESRLRVLRTQQDKLESYLEKAENMDDLLSIENKLQNVLIEIDRVESEFKQLNNKIDYAFVRINLNQRVDGYDSFFGRAQYELGETFSHMADEFISIICFILILLPWVVTLLLIVYIISKIYKFWDKSTFEKREKDRIERQLKINNMRKDSGIQEVKPVLKKLNSKKDE